MIGPHDHGNFFDDTDDNNDEGFDVEAARERLEALLVTGGGSDKTQQHKHHAEKDGNSAAASPKTTRVRIIEKPSPQPPMVPPPSPELKNVVLPPPPPLTAIERERRETEIELLSHLDDGDEALSDLWNLWFQERGPRAAARLLRAEELTDQGGPRRWEEVETILRDLIEEYGVYWVEPVNRLATLYYMQNRFEEAETLCKTVLTVKPWHFGALSGLVMVYAGMQDSFSARQWASRRLPTLAPQSAGPSRRRAAWVQRAVTDAQMSLLSAEERVRRAFGKPDEHTTIINNNSRRGNNNNKQNKKKRPPQRIINDDDDFEADAWQ